MAKPAQTSLSQWCIQAGNFSSFRECVVWNIALPDDVEYALETSHVESVKLLFLSCVKSPGLAAVQHHAQNAGSVDLDLGSFRQLLAGPYSKGAVQLKAGVGCPIKCDNLSQQWRRRHAPRQSSRRLINGRLLLPVLCRRCIAKLECPLQCAEPG